MTSPQKVSLLDAEAAITLRKLVLDALSNPLEATAAETLARKRKATVLPGDVNADAAPTDAVEVVIASVEASDAKKAAESTAVAASAKPAAAVAQADDEVGEVFEVLSYRLTRASCYAVLHHIDVHLDALHLLGAALAAEVAVTIVRVANRLENARDQTLQAVLRRAALPLSDLRAENIDKMERLYPLVEQRLAVLWQTCQHQAALEQTRLRAEQLAREEQEAAKLRETLERQQAEEEAREALLRQQQEMELLSRKKAAEEELAMRQAEADALAKQRAEMEALSRLQAEAAELARQLAAAEELTAQEAEADNLELKKVEVDELARRKAEADALAQRQAEIEAQTRLEAEAAVLIRQQAEADAQARHKAEMEALAARQQAEADALAQRNAEADALAQEQTNVGVSDQEDVMLPQEITFRFVYPCSWGLLSCSCIYVCSIRKLLHLVSPLYVHSLMHYISRSTAIWTPECSNKRQSPSPCRPQSNWRPR